MPQPLNTENILRHWEKFRPRMVAELRQKNQLQPALENAKNLTRDALGQAIEAGQAPDQAWEAVSQNWAFLPAETEDD